MTCETCKKQSAMIMVAGGFLVYCPEDGEYHRKTDTCGLDTNRKKVN